MISIRDLPVGGLVMLTILKAHGLKQLPPFMDFIK